MDVLVMGATGGTGRAVVEELLERGHAVTALSRHATALPMRSGLRCVNGDATDRAVVGPFAAGQDAVVVTLGISESPVSVRLRGPRGTRPDVRSAGTAAVADALGAAGGTARLVVLSSYGVGPSRDRLPWATRLVFRLLLAPQIADTERQAGVVRGSGLDWVLAQPVNLTDGTAGGLVVDRDGRTVSMRVSRTQVARFLADAAEGRILQGTTAALSAAG